MKRHSKRWTLGVLLALLLPAAVQARSWTLVYYMVVDERTLKSELETVKAIPGRIGNEKDVTAVLQWDTHKDDAGIFVSQNRKWAKAPGKVADNMGDPKTLYDLLQYAMTNYPADRYALVLGGHGSGFEDKWGPGSLQDQARPTSWFRKQLVDRIGRPIAPGHTKGTCYDYDDNDCLTLQESRVAIEEACRRHNGNRKLDLLAFSSCWQMNLEFLVEHAHVVDYVVGCETVSYTGTPMLYGFLDSLSREPNMATREICKIMTEQYIKGASKAGTVAWFETAGMADVVNGLNAFAWELLRMNRHPKSHGTKGANFQSVLFTDGDYHEKEERFIDVTTLLRGVETGKVGFRVSAELKSATARLRAAFKAHAGSWHRAPYSDYESWCISTFLPKTESHFRKMQAHYEKLRIAHDSQWDDYLLQRKGRGYDHGKALAATLHTMAQRQQVIATTAGTGQDTITAFEKGYMQAVQEGAIEALATETALEIREEDGSGLIALRDALATITPEKRAIVAPLLRPVLQMARAALTDLADGGKKGKLLPVLEELSRLTR